MKEKSLFGKENLLLMFFIFLIISSFIVGIKDFYNVFIDRNIGERWREIQNKNYPSSEMGLKGIDQVVLIQEVIGAIIFIILIILICLIGTMWIFSGDKT